MDAQQQQEIKEHAKEYYGKTLTGTKDLKTSACCTSSRPPRHVAEAMSLLHPEVLERYYGCGLVIPACLEGLTVVDLGCGSGHDCFILSKLVGQSGHVIGVDMTQEQLMVANKHVDYHMKAFGYTTPNIEFRQGYIEDLSGIASGSVDLIVSNCVVNLSPDKPAVLREAFRVLKEGGEMYFSDVYSDRRIPKELIQDPILHGECLSGALYWNDFLRMARAAGFIDPRLVTDRPLDLHNDEIKKLLEPAKFFSATYRLFKITGLETDCEDYGQAVIYKGTVSEFSHTFILDKHHAIEAGRTFPVCRNTSLMLQKTRFAKHFDFIGEGKVHFGIYADCGKSMPFTTANSSCSKSAGACC